MPALLNTLTQLIADEQLLYTQLNLLLVEEKEALVKSDMDGLETVTQLKTSLIQKLAENINQRILILKNHPQLAETGIQSYLTNFGSAEQLAAWDTLIETIESIQENNRLNGLLINQLSVRTQNTLAILHGPEKSNTSLYGPKGQNTSAHISRTIIS